MKSNFFSRKFWKEFILSKYSRSFESLNAVLMKFMEKDSKNGSYNSLFERKSKEKMMSIKFCGRTYNGIGCRRT